MPTESKSIALDAKTAKAILSITKTDQFAFANTLFPRSSIVDQLYTGGLYAKSTEVKTIANTISTMVPAMINDQ